VEGGAIKTFYARTGLAVDLLLQGKVGTSCAVCQCSGLGTALSPLDQGTEAL